MKPAPAESRGSRSHFACQAIACIIATVGAVSVHAQPSPDRVLWRFEMNSVISGSEVNVGPDGTIYCSDSPNLYALNPNGTIKWIRPGLGAGTPIDFLDDGTIIVGTSMTVYALYPDGTDRWTFTFDGNPGSEEIEVGPSVGPDGNIYCVSSHDGQGVGLGAFSLTPEGEFRWSDEGEPNLNLLNAHTGGRIHFTSERLIFPFRYTHDSGPSVFGYDFDGDQTLFVDFTCTGAPRTDPLNRLLISSACGIEALEQDGNESFWTVQFGAVNLPPAVGDDATLYSGSWLGVVNSINPDGSIGWTSSDADLAEIMLAVRQDVGRLIYSGGGFGVPNFVRGVDIDTGAVVWSVEMAVINDHRELVWTPQAATSADGSVVYFSTRFTSNGEPGALYAVRVLDTIAHPDDFNVFRGFHQSGELSDLLESDDSDLCYEPGIVLNPSEAPVTLDFFGTLPNDSPATLDVTIESSANTVGLELTFSFWNFNTNSWDVVGTAAQGFNTDTVRTFAGTPADHIDQATSEVRTRYEVRQVSLIFQFPWTDCIDQFFWTTVN